ncbi:hypothetical protein ETAA8_26330 [Anatilimnocola aggregata]|uniref:VWFA domain-containing protein n=1 Tax=Anatilimnocola aggregata TaxID=2528021 RepID=A0A517YBC4_9BACT|nr:vWA domain-containing protein [Anatilimnocola aggregata]QDU27545.1 hypothetical protein ETAA8_26330 [Anatilimnocola aggregata]
MSIADLGPPPPVPEQLIGEPPVLVPLVVEPSQPEPVDRLVKRSLPWMVSLVINLALLVLLALLSVTGLLDKLQSVEIMALFDAESEVAPLEMVSIGSAGTETSSMNFQTEASQEAEPSSQAPIELNQELLPTTRKYDSALLGDGALDLPAAPTNKSGLMGLPTSSDLSTLVPTTTAKGPVTERELKERTSLTEVAGDLGQEISDKLSEDNLLVVWLMDASISLVDNRLELATHLERMYAGIEHDFSNANAKGAKGQKKRLLMNSVVAFGNGAQGISAPYRIPTKALTAMRNMPIDVTGAETTCQAIMWTAMQAREEWKPHRGQLMIVVFTDESGDDTLLLEQTIEVCRVNKATVSIIGPSAVLGTDEGFHRWKHPQVREPFWLPVAKGPDSAIPERLRLPYWWSAERLTQRLNIPPAAQEFPTDRLMAVEWAAKLPAWAQGAEVNPRDYFVGSYSGRELINLNSGFPPYALMRLARETGGTYTMFDRHGDRGPFRLEFMRKYAPDYRSLPEIMDEMRYHPLRLAIVNAAMLTRKYAPQTPPQTSFIDLYDPDNFRRYCGRQFPECDAKAELTANLLEEALIPFGEAGLEKEYEREQLPRWQAWYDLVLGRLLLQSVRLAEYRMILRMLSTPQGFPYPSNSIQLFPQEGLRTGTASALRIQEGRRLLQRCLDNNPGTPWAFLAARELEHPESLDFRWRLIPVPPPSPPGPPRRPSPPSAPIVLPRL